MEQEMTFAQHLWQLVDIIAKHAVKEHYTDNGTDVEALVEIKQYSKDLSRYSHDYEAVYRHAEEVQKYIKNKIGRGEEHEHDNNG
jgi:hypothetical protein